ncbi:MAG: peptide chain release factor N(5)-glutamine methyltransferase [Gemmatimonadota bacterium]|nr:peptide chain release factor N(5)-glutamine methyltransferase [Gemmatimonadota bacterium]MDP6803165.1 peptide chain release factor N(5)-glutamine methyltransferase [Gemmatimonadota bacterium]
MKTGGTVSLRDLVSEAEVILRSGNCSCSEDPRREATTLLEAAVGATRVDILVRPDLTADAEGVARYMEMIDRRSKGVPLQLLVGKTGFHDIVLRVERGVFIPRPETEVLVELALGAIRERLSSSTEPIRVLDLCTGTGAVAIAVAASVRDSTDSRVSIHAGDLNSRAVRLARTNAQESEVADLVEVRRSDLFSAFKDLLGTVDVLTANPPYIDPKERDTLPPEVKNADPKEALFDPAGGTGFHQRIAEQAREFLQPGGWLLFEIGEAQGPEVRDQLEMLGFVDAEVLPDFAERNRIVRARWMGQE